MHQAAKSQVRQAHRTGKTRETVPKEVFVLVRIGIWERDEGIFRAVRAAVEAGNRPFPQMSSGRYLAEFVSMPLDLLALSPAAAEEGQITRGVRCRCLLLPGAAGPLAREIGAEYAVSYGTSPKDTLTFSSLEGDQICLALQRELVTVEGGVVEQQELVLPFPPGLSPLPYLAAVGVLLLSGIPAEELMGG